MRTRGMGRTYRPRFRSRKTGEMTEIETWWIRYSHRGVEYRESSHSDKESDAVTLLRKRNGEMGKGRVMVDVEKTTFEDMAEMVVNDYKQNGLKSLNRVEDAINHLKGFFGGGRAVDIKTYRVTAYVTERQDEGAANATINNELAALKRMFKLAGDDEKVAHCPHIKKLKLDNTREGFFELEQFTAVLRHLPEDLRPMVETAYVTGWRIHSEILTRQRHHVDLDKGTLRLDPGETKNREGREFPFTPRLRDALECQIEKTEALQMATGQIIPWLFHRNGKQIKTFRRSWITACRLAGVPGRIPHDFRRTAIRNMERAEVSRSTAMESVGHKTESIYRRYAIVDAKMQREGAKKLARLDAADQRALEQNKTSRRGGEG